MNSYIYISIIVAALTSFAIRTIPLFLIKKPIKNIFIKSFLYYVPYVTLAVMLFPAIIFETQYLISGIIVFVVGVFLSWKKQGMFQVAVACCLVAFICDFLINLI